eukprot:TRINITY_DN6126_c0_g2_i1.p1 TRINITY_DN6126_c0_g2~~TRINITY_DN6126_c0_g2_i1.p1  ORF type:complete len:120 (+),score=20.84 TRINITY_DN6126_c0_g2_i1:193-552(+)
MTTESHTFSKTATEKRVRTLELLEGKTPGRSSGLSPRQERLVRLSKSVPEVEPPVVVGNKKLYESYRPSVHFFYFITTALLDKHYHNCRVDHHHHVLTSTDPHVMLITDHFMNELVDSN